MDLNSIILPEKVVTFEYPGLEGLEFDLAYISKESLQDLIKKATTQKFNSKTKATVDNFDEAKFLELYIAAVVRDWRGFKMKHLDSFIPADFSDSEEDQEIDFSLDNALALVKASTVLDDWIAEQVGTLENFTKRKPQKNLKKSKPTSVKAVAD